MSFLNSHHRTMRKSTSSGARLILLTLVVCTMGTACHSPGGSSVQNTTMVDLYGDSHCINWSCEGDEGSSALDQSKLQIEGTTWLIGEGRPIEEVKGVNSARTDGPTQTVWLVFGKDGRLTCNSIDQVRDRSTKKINTRVEKLEAHYVVTPGYIELLGVDTWFTYVKKAKVTLQESDSPPFLPARWASRLSLELMGGTKSTDLHPYVKGFNREIDASFQRLLDAAASKP